MKINSTKMILVLSSIMALQMTSFVIILPLFARRFTEFGAGVEALGISEMAYALASTLAAPVMGTLSDRLGRKPMVLVSLAAYALAFSGYLLAPSVEIIILLRGLAGALTAGLIPAVTSLAADLAPTDRRAQWISFISSGASFGWIAGPIAGGVLYDRWGYSTALITSILMATAAFLAAFLILPNHSLLTSSSPTSIARRTGHYQHKGINNFWCEIRRTLPNPLTSFILLLTIAFVVLFAWAFIEPVFMFYAYNDLGWSSSMLGLMMSTYGIALMLGELGLGQLSDRLGRKPVIIAGLLFFSAQFIGLAFFNNYIFIAAGFIVGGLGNALYDPAINASILDITPEEHRGRILGMKSMAGSLGNILGPALVALLSSTMNARVIFLISVIVVLLTACFYLYNLIKEKRKGSRTGRSAKDKLVSNVELG